MKSVLIMLARWEKTTKKSDSPSWNSENWRKVTVALNATRLRQQQQKKSQFFFKLGGEKKTHFNRKHLKSVSLYKKKWHILSVANSCSSQVGRFVLVTSHAAFRNNWELGNHRIRTFTTKWELGILFIYYYYYFYYIFIFFRQGGKSFQTFIRF